MSDQQQRIVPVMATQTPHQSPLFLPDPAILHQEQLAVPVTTTSSLCPNRATQPDPGVSPREPTDPTTAPDDFQPNVTPLKSRLCALAYADQLYTKSQKKMAPLLAHRRYTRQTPVTELEEKERMEIVSVMHGLYVALWRASSLHEDPNVLIRELEDSTRWVMAEPAEAREKLKEQIRFYARSFTLKAGGLVNSLEKTLGGWERAFGARLVRKRGV